MTATDELRRLLDELGVEWTVPDESWNQDSITYWKVGSIKWVAFESENGTLWLNCNSVTDLTPEQAIAATLGDVPRLPYFWTADGTLHIELPKLPESISVRLPDQRDREVGSARVWQYTLGSGTCQLKPWEMERDTGAYDCMQCVCGYVADVADWAEWCYCPSCGRKVVDA